MVLFICLCILGLLVLLGVVSGREQGALLQRMSMYLYKFCCVHKLPVVERQQVSVDLERQNPGMSSRELLTDYYVEKFRMVLLVLVVGCLLTVLLALRTGMDTNMGADAVLERGKAGEGEQEVLLSATIDGEEEEVVVHVVERQLKEEELEELFLLCISALEEIIPGDNKSLSEIEGDMILPESMEGYPFEIVWKSSDPTILKEDGSLRKENIISDTHVCLTAKLYYGERSYDKEWLIHIPRIEMEVTTKRKLIDAIAQSDEQSRYEEVLPLPEELEGETIEWKKVTEDNSFLFLLLTMCAAVGVFVLMDKDLHEKTNMRKRGLKIAYPTILNKFVLYMGAGMTVRGSFLKVANDYNKGVKKKQEDVAYEEMLYSCHELSAGVSEGLVYERFGKRSGLQEYARFAAMLGQNLKKGNTTLLARLREESDKAMLEDIQFRKKLGEEAQTKLLVPMIMMLGMVMLLVMLPAFSAF